MYATRILLVGLYQAVSKVGHTYWYDSFSLPDCSAYAAFSRQCSVCGVYDSLLTRWFVHLYIYMCVCVCARARACVCVCVHIPVACDPFRRLIKTLLRRYSGSIQALFRLYLVRLYSGPSKDLLRLYSGSIEGALRSVPGGCDRYSRSHRFPTE